MSWSLNLMQEKVSAQTAASCFNTTTDGWEDEKKAGYFTLLKRITRSKKKVNARYSGPLFNTATDSKKKVMPDTAANCLTRRQVTGEKWEKANCYTLLRRIAKLKIVNSVVRSNVKGCSLDRDSPKGSYHLVEPAGRTHLYRKAIRICDLECNVRAKN